MEPPSYHHIHPAADELVQLAASHRLTLRSELGVPTFYVISDRMTNTTIDLVWTNQEAFDLTTTCITDVSLEHSYSSDHAAILSTTDLPDSQSPITPPPAPKRVWKQMDKPLLSSSLASSLSPLTASLPLKPSPNDLHHYVLSVTEAVNSSISAHVPLAKPVPNARRWCDEAILGPMERKTSSLRRKYQRHKSKDNRLAYLTAAKSFHHTILRLKHGHWKAFLLSLEDKTLFTAARFTDGPTPSSFIPPIRGPDGALASDPSLQADLIFGGTSAPKEAIALSDIPPPAIRQRSSPPFTIQEALDFISGLKPSKAPGPA